MRKVVGARNLFFVLAVGNSELSKFQIAVLLQGKINRLG